MNSFELDWPALDLLLQDFEEKVIHDIGGNPHTLRLMGRTQIITEHTPGPYQSGLEARGEIYVIRKEDGRGYKTSYSAYGEIDEDLQMFTGQNFTFTDELLYNTRREDPQGLHPMAT